MYRIGIDLGGTTISGGIIDDNYTIIKSETIDTTKVRDDSTAMLIAHDIVALVNRLTESVTAENPSATFSAIGIGVPASVENNIIIDANNLGLVNADIATEISDICKLPVNIINDARAAGLAEYYAGSGKGAESFLMLTLGTGVGSSYVINGNIVTGCNNSAGELGHMVINMNGKPCTCGRRGCFEVYASASALVEEAHQMDAAITNGKLFFNKLSEGSKEMQDVFETYLDYLACGITNIINTLQPDIIAIGGGISSVGDTLLTPLKARVQSQVYTQHSNKQTELKIAELKNDAGIIGAAISTNN